MAWNPPATRIRVSRQWLGASWLWAVLGAVALTPILRLPGGIPLRLDDLLILGGLAVFLLEHARGGSVPRPSEVGTVLLLTAAWTLLITAVGPPIPGLSVDVREYLDAMRPLKFAAVLLLVRHMDVDLARECFLTASLFLVVLLDLFALVQLLLLEPESFGWLAKLSLLFSELEEWHVRSLFGVRPFATFHTPADLGFFMALALLAAIVLDHHPWRRLLLGSLAALGIVLSGTRTFLFGVPLILLLAVLLQGRSLKSVMKLGAITALLIAAGTVLTVYLMEDFLSSIQLTLTSLLTADFAVDQSIVERLQNLTLVELTFQVAPWTGMISRDFFTRGVDSDYIITFHRYGIIGIGLTLLLYAVAVGVLWPQRSRPTARFALLSLATTFMYGLTQSSLGSTRVGLLPFIVLGLALARPSRMHQSTSDLGGRTDDEPSGERLR